MSTQTQTQYDVIEIGSQREVLIGSVFADNQEAAEISAEEQFGDDGNRTLRVVAVNLIYYVWGDGACHELDRFHPEIDSDPNLPEPIKSEYLAWWESAREPWCCILSPVTPDIEHDVVLTCNETRCVEGFYIDR